MTTLLSRLFNVRPSTKAIPEDVQGNAVRVRICFVCMGNICRSPLAEAIARGMAEQQGLSHAVEFDSAGTHGYHAGEPPDDRACRVGAARGYRLEHLRARKFLREDFARFDLVLVADLQNLEALERLVSEDEARKLRLIMSFAPECGVPEVPDPYYGGMEGFVRVADLCQAASVGILDYVRRAIAEP